MDTPEENKKFAEELGIGYPLLSDPDRQVARAYGVIDPEEGLAQRWTFYIGADGKILAIDRDVHPRSAGADVAATLERLGIKPGP